MHVYTKDSDVVDEYDEAVKQEDEENGGGDEGGFTDDANDTNDTGAGAIKQEES